MLEGEAASGNGDIVCVVVVCRTATMAWRLRHVRLSAVFGYTDRVSMTCLPTRWTISSSPRRDPGE